MHASFCVLFCLFSFALCDTFTWNSPTDGGNWAVASNWGGGCTNCYPGKSGTADSATFSVTNPTTKQVLTLDSGTIVAPGPDFTINCNVATECEFDVNLSGVTLGDGTISSGVLNILEDANISDLSVDDTVTIANGKTLSTSSVALQVGSTLTGSGSLTANGNIVINSAALSLGTNLNAGTIDIKETSTTTMNSGTISGTLLQIRNGGKFDFQSGSINGIGVLSAGTLDIASSVNSPSSDIRVTIAGELNLDSSAGVGVSIVYNDVDIRSALSLICPDATSPVSISGTTSAYNTISVSGVAGCTASVTGNLFDEDITITDATLSLSSSGDIELQQKVDVSSGALDVSGSKLILSASSILDITDTGSLLNGGLGVQIQSESTSTMNFLSNSDFTLDISHVGAGSSGALTVNNVDSTVTFSGSSLMKNGAAWSFQSCTKINFSQDFDANAVTINCPADFNSITNVNGIVSITSGVKVAAGASFIQSATGSDVSLTAGAVFTSFGTTSLSDPTIDGSTLVVSTGSTTIAGTPTITSGTITLSTGTLDISGTNSPLTFQTGSTLNWNGGSIMTDPSKTIEFSGSSFSVNAASASFSGILSLDATSTFTADSTITFSTGSLTATTGSILNFNADQEFALDFPVTVSSGSATVNHNSGSLTLNNAVTVTDSSWSSAAGSTILVNERLTFTGATVTGNGNLIANGEVNINGGATWTQASATINGNFHASAVDSAFSSGPSVFGASATILCETSADCYFSDPTFVVGTQFTSQSSAAIIFLNAGTLFGDFISDGGNIAMDTGNLGSVTNSANISFSSAGSYFVISGVVTQVNTVITSGFSNSGIILFTSASSLTWTTDTTLDFTISGAGDLIINSSSFVIPSGSNVILNAGSFIDNGGGVSVTGYGRLQVRNGEFTLTQAATFADSASIDIGGSTLSFPRMVFTDYAKLLLYTGTTTLEDPVVFSGGRLYVRNSGTIVNLNGEFAMGNSYGSITESSVLNVNTDIDLISTRLTISSDSAFNLNSGNVTITPGSTLYFTDSDFNVENGNIVFPEGSVLRFYDQSTANLINSGTGRIYMQTGSILEISSSSQIDEEKDPFVLEEDVVVRRYNGGGNTQGNQTITYPDTDPCHEFSEQIESFVEQTTVIVTGCVELDDSTFEFEDSNLQMRQEGSLLLDNMSRLTISVEESDEAFSYISSDASATITLKGDSYAIISAPITITATTATETHFELEASGASVYNEWEILGSSRVHIHSDSYVYLSNKLSVLGTSELRVEDSVFRISQFTFSFCFFGFCFTSPPTLLTLEGDLLVDRSSFALGDGLSISGSGLAQFTETRVTSNYKAQITIANDGEFVGRDSTSITIGERLTMSDGSKVILSGGSALAMNVTARVYMYNTAFIDLDRASAVSVDGPVYMYTNATIDAYDRSAFIVLGGGDLIMYQDSILRAANNFSTILIDGGDFSMYTRSRMYLEETGQFVITGGSQMELYGESKVELSDRGGMSIFESGSISADDSSEINLEDSSVAVLNGTISLVEFAKMNLKLSSSFLIYGNLSLTDNTEIVLESSSILYILSDTAPGKVDLQLASKIQNNDARMEVRGSLFLNDDAEVTGDDGDFLLYDEQLECRDNATVTLTNNSYLEINGGELNAFNSSTIFLEESSISILNRDMNIFGNAKLHLEPDATILVSGGNAYFRESSDTIIAESILEVNQGTSYCQDNAEILVKTNSLFSVSSASGSALFEDSCIFKGQTNGTFSSSGNTRFTDNAFVSLLTSSKFNVVGGDSIFMDNATAVFSATSLFTVSNGNAYLQDDASIQIGSSSSFRVLGGNAYLFDNSEVRITQATANMIVQANFEQNNETRVLLNPGTLTVGGSFVSRDNSSLDATNSNIILNGNANVEITDVASWRIEGGSFLLDGGGGDFTVTENATLVSISSTSNLDGNVNLNNNGYVSANQTNYIIRNGNFTASHSSEMFLYDSSSLSVTTGDVLFQDNSVLFIDGTSDFRVEDGNVVFQHFNNFLTESGTSIEVEGGSLTFQGSRCLLFPFVNLNVGGDLNMKLDSCLNFVSSVVLIEGGNLHAIDNFALSFSNTSITVDTGNAIFNGTLLSSLHFVDIPFDILEGDASFIGDTKPNFLRSVLTVTNGGASFGERTISTWDFSSIVIEDIQVDPFVTFKDDAVALFKDSELQVTGGFVSLLNQVNSTWIRSNITLDGADLNFVGSGEHILTDSNVSVTGSAGALFSGSLFSSFDSTDFIVSTDGSTVTFAESVTIEFEDMLFDIQGGAVILSGESFLSYLNSNFQISDGSLFASDSIQYTLVNTPLSIQASVEGGISASENAKFKLTNSPINMQSGDVSFYGNSTLQFTDIGTTLSMFAGNFIFEDTSDFLTVQGTQIDIVSGSFELLDFVDISFDQVTTSVGGSVILTDSTKLESLESVFNIIGGTLDVQLNSRFLTTSSQVNVTSGSLSTSGSSTFHAFSSKVNVFGNIVFRGDALSDHFFNDSIINIFDGGDLLTYEHISSLFLTSTVFLQGGFVSQHNFSETIFRDHSILSLQGTGTLLMYDSSHMSIEDSSTVQVITAGATATFSDFSRVDVSSLSTFDINDGSVSFEDNSTFNIWDGTFFNLLDGSLFLLHDSRMTAYPFTEGTIVGGNLHVRDHACLSFIQSSIDIVGSIDNNSTCSVTFLGGTNITVTGTVQITGTGIIHISNGSFLHVIDGNIILFDFAEIQADDALIVVSGGSILAYDFSNILADNSTEVIVQGGNITIHDEATMQIFAQSSVLVTSTNTTQGAVYAEDFSFIHITESSELVVNQGNLTISDHADVLNEENSVITVIAGDLKFLDYSTFNAMPTSTVEVLADGNLYAAGIGTSLSFCEATTRVVQGDMISALRTSLISKQSTFEVSDAGNVILTDITRTIMEENSSLNIFGGGNLELLRSAYFLLGKDSSATVGNGGSALFGEDVIFELDDHSSLRVDGGDISFYADASLTSTFNSIGEVTSGGSILFSESTSATLSDSSRLSVFDFGSISFSGKSSAQLSSNSFLFVQDGGNIEFQEAAELDSDHSFLTVSGGGSILLSGTGTSNIINESQFLVSGGNIEYRNEKRIFFDSSSFTISSGNFLTFDNTIFNMEQQSTGSITGGNFVLRDSSLVNVFDDSSVAISSGNVQMFNNGIVNMNTSTITVSGNDATNGNFELNNFVQLLMDNSLVTISGGNFDSRGSVTTSSVSSSISVSSGSATFSGSSEYSGRDSELLVSGGHLNILDATVWTLSKSLASVSGGSLQMSGTSRTSLSDSLFDVSGGNINLRNNGNLSILSSILQVTGGDLYHTENSLFESEESKITISSGRIIYDGNSHVNMQSTEITIEQYTSITTRLPKPIEINDLMIFGGSSFVHVYENSVLDLIRGNLVFVESASGLIEETSITISGGNLASKSNSQVQFVSAVVTLLEGTLSGSDTSTISFIKSSVDISGGSLIIEEENNFSLLSSSISVTGGSVIFTGGISSFESSQVSVLGEGSLQFIGEVELTTTNSQMTLSGSGDFQFGDNVNASIRSSILSINSGTFTTSGSSRVEFSFSMLNIAGGSTFFSGNSQIDIIDSTMTVLDGNVHFLDESRVIIHSGSEYSVQGGNVFTEASAALDISDSCFVLNQGTVHYSEQSIINLTSSCWNITGGNSIFSDFASYSLSEHSLLSIESGSFLASDSVSIQIDSSRAHVRGGDFRIEGNSALSLRSGSVVEVEEGNAIFSGTIETTVDDSSFLVTGGFVEFDGNSRLTWRNSLLDVTAGDMITKGSTVVAFIESEMQVSGGGLRFIESSKVSFADSTVRVTLGSLNFHDDCIVDLIDTSVRVENGDIQFGGQSQVSFLRSPIYLAGQLEFIDNTKTIFTESDIKIIGGSFHSKDFTDVKFLSSKIEIGGSFHIQNDADVTIQNCWMTIDNGDLRILDRGTFTVQDTSLKIVTGDFVIMNPSNERKFVSISDSIVSVGNQEQSGSSLSGNVNLSDNVEMTLTQSDFIIDGNLILTGNSMLNIYEESSFVIPTGVVEMAKESRVQVDFSSSLLNRGQLVAPGELNAPSGSSVNNEGILESSHDVTVNCGLENVATLENSGSFSLAPSDDSSSMIQSCINNLHHSGVMQFTRSNVTFQQVETSENSIFTLSGSSVQVIDNQNTFDSRGSLGGSGNFKGSLSNSRGGVFMANGENGASRVVVDDQFTSSGSMFFVINSRNLNDPNAITQVSAGGVSLSGGRACVCFNPSLELEEDDQFDLVEARTRLDGRFDSVEFDCLECPRRNAKSLQGIAATDAGCEPSADYKAASFSVLFNGCGNNNDDYFDAVSPPWYVIFPVAVGVVVLVVLVFGGGLTLEQKYRSRITHRKIAKKRKIRNQQFKESLLNQSDANTSFSSA